MTEAAAALARQRGLEGAVAEAQEELRVSAGLEASGLKERIGARLDRFEARAARRIARATGVLATIGAVRRSSVCSAPSGAS